jgi:hypothetical protein
VGVYFILRHFGSGFGDHTDVHFESLPESLWVGEVSVHLLSFISSKSY